MDVQQFLSDFGHIANAPGGVARLRDLTLFLAVRGKLVGHEDTDQSGNDLLDEIAQLKETESRTRFRILETISKAGEPYSIPKHWAWARLGDLVDLLDSQRKPITKNKRRSGSIPYYGASGIVDYVAEHIFDEDLVLVGEDGAKWARGEATAFKISGKSWVNNHAHVLRPRRSFVSDEFLTQVLVEMDITGFTTGMTVPKLNQAKLISIPIPLPPPNEQARIVAKVDEIMNLCNHLEQQQQKRRRLQNALRQSSLQAIADSKSSLELETSWKRLDSNFQLLFSEKGDVRKLRDVLCDLAMRGIIVPTSTMGQGQTFDDVVLRPLSHGWEWKPLSKLSEYITSGSRGWKKYTASKGDSFIRSQDIKHDELIYENPAFVKLPEKAEGMRTLVQPSDLLITITGGNVGRCAVVPDLPQDAYVSQHVALIRLLDPKFSEFIHYWMVNAFGGQAFLARYIYGDKPGLNLKQVGSVLIPVPPIEMLPEILPSLRSYHEMCERLSDQLEEKLDISEKFVIAAVNSITGTSLVEEGPATVKVPQTELIAPLRLGKVPKATAQAPLTTILARHDGELPARDLWQRFGGEIDTFYAQLKTEVGHGWIAEPAVAEMLERPAEAAGV